jgi:hypothetical protein
VNRAHYVPTSLIGEAVAQGAHVVSDCRPFRAADDANVLDRQNGEEEVLVGPVVPILVHRNGDNRGIGRQRWEQVYRLTGWDTVGWW